jgi:site-specific recombinase XerD
VGTSLGDLDVDARDDHWLNLRGKGDRPGRVAIPMLARAALNRYLNQRGLPTTRSMWDPAISLVGRIDLEDSAAISPSRLWAVMRRFFRSVANVVQKGNPGLAAKLLRASPHWMRHTHATQALERGAEITAVRDNLRHASIGTTSTYLHGDDSKRARQMNGAFPASGTPHT